MHIFPLRTGRRFWKSSATLRPAYLIIGRLPHKRISPLNTKGLSGILTGLLLYVGETGFEPATSWSQTKRSSQAELHPVNCIIPSYPSFGNLPCQLSSKRFWHSFEKILSKCLRIKKGKDLFEVIVVFKRYHKLPLILASNLYLHSYTHFL